MSLRGQMVSCELSGFEQERTLARGQGGALLPLAEATPSSPDAHPLDMTNTVTELPARSIRSFPSAAPPLGAADELAADEFEPADAPVGSSPLNGTSAGSGFAGTTWVALLTSFDVPNTCEAESTAKPSGIDSVTGFPPTEAASLALITVARSEEHTSE